MSLLITWMIGLSPVTVGLPGERQKGPCGVLSSGRWAEALATIGVANGPLYLQSIHFGARAVERFFGSIARYCDVRSKSHYFPSWAGDVFTDGNVLQAPDVPEWADGLTWLFAENICEVQGMPAVLDAT